MSSPNEEAWSETWRRRAVTLPLLFLFGPVALLGLPLWVLLALLASFFEPRRWAILRCVGLITTWVVGECVFVTIAFGQWLLAPGWTRGGAVRLARWTDWLANTWGTLLQTSARLYFGLRLEVRGLDALDAGGPLLVMMRHASMTDSLLAPVYVGRYAGLAIRYVVKRELRMDPVFDVVGGRIVSYFVRRGSVNPAQEVRAVCALLEDLGPRDAVLIYPEGTRFSPTKRTRTLEKAKGQLSPELFARAEALRHMLPPRLGGPIALLEGNPGADVLLCTHIGYEQTATFRDLWTGRAIDQRIEVQFRRVPFAEIPTGRDALISWLFDEWARLDAWIEERAHATSLAPAPAISTVAAAAPREPGSATT